MLVTWKMSDKLKHQRCELEQISMVLICTYNIHMFDVNSNITTLLHDTNQNMCTYISLLYAYIILCGACKKL